jgi:hypothetical protein
VIVSVDEIVDGMVVAWANPVPRNTMPESAAVEAAMKTDSFILVVPSLIMLGISGETEYLLLDLCINIECNIQFLGIMPSSP